MRLAAAADAPVQVVQRGRGYEVVVVPGQELQPAGLRRERSERYREVHQLERLVAHGDYSRTGVCYSARFVFIFAYVVDYISENNKITQLKSQQ